MSYGKEKPFIHPFTFFIVQYGVEDPIRAMRLHSLIEALEALYFFLKAVDPEIKKDLFEEIGILDGMRKGTIIVDEYKIDDIMGKVYDKLHAAGYFLAAKMRPPTRETSMKDLQITVDKAKYAKDREKSS